MTKIDYSSTVAVTVGRFESSKLTDAHIKLLTEMNKHARVLVMIGTSVKRGTKKYPLDYETRRLMVLTALPSAIIVPIEDIPGSNEAWSDLVDKTIRLHFPHQEIVLYGGRDSYIPSYTGSVDLTVEIEEVQGVSATALREKVAFMPKNSQEFREGVIYSVMNDWPKAWPAVDVAIFDGNRNILMAKRDGKYKFIGGFVDPTKDDSYKQAALREAREEAGDLELVDPFLIDEVRVDDWRYRDEPVEKVFTTLIGCKYVYGSPKPSDDLKGWTLEWIDPINLPVESVMLAHQPLIDMVKDYLKPRQCS